MLPIDDIKAPQGKTLELGQSQPAKGRGKKGWGSSPMARTERPLPRPDSRGNAHPGSEQERKRHVLTGVGLTQSPGRVENLLILSLGFPGESVSRERYISARKRNVLLLLSDFQLRFQTPQAGLPVRGYKQDKKEVKFLKMKASPKR